MITLQSADPSGHQIPRYRLPIWAACNSGLCRRGNFVQLSCIVLMGSVCTIFMIPNLVCSAFTPYSICHPSAMPCICEPLIAQCTLRPLRWGPASSDKPADLLHVSIQISRAVREENRISPTCRSIAAFDRPARSPQNPTVSPWSRPRDQLAEFICPGKPHDNDF